jgi:hypothetical protein
MLFHISVQHAVGGMSGDRMANFGWLALGFSISNFIGPTFTGLAIDTVGHANAFLLLSIFALISFLLLHARRETLPHIQNAESAPPRASALDLLAHDELRRVFVVTGLLASAWDLFGLRDADLRDLDRIVRIDHRLHPRKLRDRHHHRAARAPLALAAAARVVDDHRHALRGGRGLRALSARAHGPAARRHLVPAGAWPGCHAALDHVAHLRHGASGRAGEAVGVRSVVLNARHTVLPLAFGGLGATLGMSPVFWSMSIALAAGGCLRTGGAWWVEPRRRCARHNGASACVKM